VLDTVLRSGTDMILVIPTYPLLVTLSAYVRSLDVITMALLLAAFSWPFAARTIRAQVMSLGNRPYIDLAKLSGQSDFQIIFQEILPNLLPYLGVGYATATVGAILAETAMELIGLGPSGIATLGLIINWAIGWGVMTLGFWQLLNMINIGLDEAFNPRLKRVTGL
jgi:peptide/nickel transport system permease protein